MTEQIINPEGNKEPAEEIEVVDICSTGGDLPSNGAHESDNVNQDAANVSGVATPVEAKGEVIRGAFACSIKVFDLKVAFADNVVVADNDSGNGREENRVCAEVGGEVVRRGEQIPRITISVLRVDKPK